MAERWINFKELRERLNPLEILAFYKVNVKVKGDQAQGFCPLPGHSTHEGKRRSPSFSINLKRGIFQCFSCGQSGNLIDLAVLLEGFDPRQSSDVRKVALLLDERCPALGKSTPPAPSRPPERKAPTPPSQNIIINARLDFELKHLDPKHPYLASRGFTPETIDHFGLGYCGKGMMNERIAIPLHDPSGNLIGYAGRLVDDARVSEDKPKYLFPGSRERGNTLHEFHKSEFLYNGDRITSPVDDLIVVEGFASVWWLWQHGYADVVALMGSSVNDRQVYLLNEWLNPDGRLWILSDGDAAGERCAHDLFSRLAPRNFVRWARLDKGQPTDLSNEELADVLAKS
jgi:DNA primase